MKPEVIALVLFVIVVLIAFIYWVMREHDNRPIYRVRPIAGGFHLEQCLGPLGGWHDCGEYLTLDGAEEMVKHLEGKTLFIYESRDNKTVKQWNGETLYYYRETSA